MVCIVLLVWNQPGVFEVECGISGVTDDVFESFTLFVTFLIFCSGRNNDIVMTCSRDHPEFRVI